MSGTRRKIPDAQARWEAITTANHAFVWASAGTGKTHTLILRALYLLLNTPFSGRRDSRARGDLPDAAQLYQTASRPQLMQAARSAIHSLVMTTFTRKAAAEMQTRLYRYLESIAAADSLTEFQANWQHEDPFFWRIVEEVLDNLGGGADMPLLATLDRGEAFDRLRAGTRALAELASELQISTIHSLAVSILRRHPLHAGVPPTTRFAREDEDEFTAIEDQVIDRWWQQEVISDSGLRDQVSELLGVVSFPQMRHWLRECYRFRWIPQEVKRLTLEEVAEEEPLLEAGYALVAALSRGNGSKIKAGRDDLQKALDGVRGGGHEAWTNLCSVVEKNRSGLFLSDRVSKTVRTAIETLEPAQARYFQSWTDFYLPVLRLCLQHEFEGLWETWTQFLERFTLWIDQAVVQQMGLVTFDEMIRLTVRLLEQHPQVRGSEQRRLRSVLVDEFQDTDFEQLRLLKELLRRDEGASHEVIGYFVGDTKQSIYRFRGVDVPSIADFHRNYESYVGCRAPCRDFRLTTSFRSLSPVTRFVNHFFEDPLDLTQPADALVPVRDGDKGMPEWILIDADENGEPFTADGARDFAAAQTLELIRDYLGAKDGQELRSYSDVMVLVREAADVDALVPVLQRSGIPAITSGAKTFFRRAEVLDVLNLLIALINPLDHLATAAVLRSPLVYLSDPDIHALMGEMPPQQIVHSQQPLPHFLSNDARIRIQRLRELVLLRREQSLEEWVYGGVRAFIPGALYTEPDDQEGRALVRINRVLERFLREAESALTTPLVWLLKQRRRAVESERWDVDPGEDVTVGDENVNAVRVMTIHKAKGLQSSFVIVYGWTSVLLELTGPRGRSRLYQTLDLTTDKGERLHGFSLAWGRLSVLSTDFNRAHNQEVIEARAEGKRLAYVAATRAADRLVLLCSASKGRRFTADIAALLGDAKKAVENKPGGYTEMCGETARFLYRQGAEARSPELTHKPLELNVEQYKALWSGRYASCQVPSSRLLRRPTDGELPPQQEVGEEAQVGGGGDRGIAMTAGQWVHAYLERHLLDERFDGGKLEVVSRELPEPAVHTSGLVLAARALSRFFSGKLPGGSRHSYAERIRAGRILGREVPVFLTDKHQAWHGVIDLVLEEEGMVMGIDYKTSAPKDPLPEEYDRQLRVYTRALERAFPERTVNFEFWWLG